MESFLQMIRDAEDQIGIRILTAFLIIFAFWKISSGIAYLIIKTLKVKEKNPTNIKNSSLYAPLKGFIKLVGIYLAILFMHDYFNFKPEVLDVIVKGFKIITILTFARGFAVAFSEKSSIAKKIRKKTTKDDAMANAALKVIRGIIYVIAGIIIISILGFDLGGLIAGFGISGIIITLAAQDTAKNIFGGIVILIDKPFVVGDWIEVDKYEGTVEEITFRSTRIRTFENSVVNIPNSKMSDASVTNWSKMEKRRYKAKLYLDINTPLEKVEQLIERIKKVLLKHEQIEDNTILVKFEEIVDSSIEVTVLSYTDSVDYNSYMAEREVINYKIMKIVNEENIKLAENAQIVHINT